MPFSQHIEIHNRYINLDKLSIEKAFVRSYFYHSKKFSKKKIIKGYLKAASKYQAEKSFLTSKPINNMINYSNYHEAVIALHERGFSEDFVLFGNDLLWVQEKTFVTPEDFSIIECHHVDFPRDDKDDLVIFGIMTFCKNVKGILMNHYSFSLPIPRVIIAKLKTMQFY